MGAPGMWSPLSSRLCLTVHLLAKVASVASSLAVKPYVRGCGSVCYSVNHSMCVAVRVESVCVRKRCVSAALERSLLVLSVLGGVVLPR